MKSRELSIIAIIIIASVSFHSFSGTTLAADADTDKQSDKMDSVLDKLESRFLDKEASPLTYDEQRTKAMTPSGKPTESIKINKKEPIIGQTPNHKILNEIQLKLNEYENQVDALEADARRFKGQVIQNSTTDNYVTIEAKLKDSKTSNLRAFTSKIDGSLTFNQVDPAGMWMPASSVIIYHGPMQPGDHTIDITAVLNRINPDGLAISGSIPQQISKSFKLTLDPGRIRRQWSIQLDTSPNQSGSAVAIFVEAPKEVNLSPNATRIAVPIEVQDSNMRQKNDSQEVAK